MPEHISGTVRFSVESLLYYSPKITRTGEDLATAATAAQRQLLGLGDFFGRSWPDQPFRDSYPRAQYALLIIAAQLADEIQGIGGGIQQMARNYGITENQNTADITRIQQDQGRANMTLYHTGGLPAPPDTPIKFSAPPDPSMVPHPQAGPAPAPSPSASLGAAADHAATAASFTTAPAPHPTPSPQPGLDPANWRPTGWGRSPFNLLDLAGPWPSGKPNLMDEAADCWSRLITALDTAWTDLQRYTTYILSDAQGPAADAFQDYVDGLTATGHGSLTRAIQAAQDLHDVCLKQAAEVRNLQRTLEEIAAELVATFVINQFVSLITFETTQALGDALEVGIAARLTQFADDFATVGRLLGSKVDAVVEGVSKIAASAVTAGVQSGILAEFDLAADNAIVMAYGDKPAAGTTALKTLLEVGALGAVFGQGSASGVFGASAAAASRKLISMGEAIQKADRESQAAAALVRIGMQLKDGGITVSAANAAVTQLITQHELTPVTFFSSAISNRFTTAITPAVGKHARGY